MTQITTTQPKLVNHNLEYYLNAFKQQYPAVYEDNEQTIIKMYSLLSECSEVDLSRFISEKLDKIRSYAHILHTITEEYSALDTTKILQQRLKESNSKNHRSNALVKNFSGQSLYSDIAFDELEARSVMNRTTYYFNSTNELSAKNAARINQLTLLEMYLNLFPQTDFIKKQLELVQHGIQELTLLASQIDLTLKTFKGVLESTDNFIHINLPLVSKVRELKSSVVNINGTLATAFFDDENLRILQGLNNIIKNRIQEFREYKYFDHLQEIFRLCNKKKGFFKTLFGAQDNSDDALKKCLELEQKIGYFWNDLNKLHNNAKLRLDNAKTFYEGVSNTHQGKDSLLALLSKSEQLITEIAMINADIENVRSEIIVLRDTIVQSKRA